MNRMVVLLLSLSLSASIIAAALLALKPLYRERLSKRWQYYIWLVVVVRLLLPFAPETNLMGHVFGALEQPPALSSAAEGTQRTGAPPPEIILPHAVPRETAPEAAQAPAPAPAETGVLRDLAAEYLWIIWLLPAALLLVRKLTGYHSFLRYIRAGREEVLDEEVLTAYQRACEQMGVRTIPPIYHNRLAASPMLVGILEPSIILPELDLEPEALQLVFCHELAHHKRRDLLYKWLVQIAVCLHWFNPAAYLVSREVAKSCELSCDELVVSCLSPETKARYGDTLLATAGAGGGYNDVAASVTLSEDGENLKERLGAILQFRMSSPRAKLAAGCLSVLLLCAAAYAGAYAGYGRVAVTVAETAALTVTAAEDSPAQSPAIRSGLPEVADELPVATESRKRPLEQAIEEQIEFWAGTWAAGWLDWGENWAEQWAGQWDFSEFEDSYNWENWDSWYYLEHLYQDGYLVGLGIPNNRKLEDYATTETLTVDGKSYTIAFAEGYEAYANDAKVLELVRRLIAEKAQIHDSARVKSATFFAVRSVHYSTDRAALLREFYRDRAFVEFLELVEHCGGLPVIEELLYQSLEDEESLYFMFLAEQLPADFAGEALARKAAEKKDVIMLGAMEPFISQALHDALWQEVLDLPLDLY